MVFEFFLNIITHFLSSESDGLDVLLDLCKLHLNNLFKLMILEFAFVWKCFQETFPSCVNQQFSCLNIHRARWSFPLFWVFVIPLSAIKQILFIVVERNYNYYSIVISNPYRLLKEVIPEHAC